MSTSITFNGVSYTVPAIADASWGTNVSNYLIAISTGCLQKTGGAFTLTAEIDFGATYGIKAPYFKSKTTNIASTGILALAKTDSVVWRNNANSGDLALGISASDILQFNSIALVDVSSSQTLTNKLLSDSTVKFANVSDATKLLMFSLGGATTGKTMTIQSSHTVDRTLTIPDATDTLLLVAATQSPTNKTFDSTSTMTGVKIASFTPDGTHTLTFPSSTDTIVGRATSDTLTNKTLTTPNLTGGSYLLAQTQGAIRFQDSSTNYVGIAAPTSVTTHSYALPTAQGGSSTVLSNDGSGNLSWASALTTTLAQFDTFIGNASNVATATNTNLLGDVKGSYVSATVTMTIATPCVVTYTSHGLSNADKIYFTTSGALPTGVSSSTTYWITVIDTDTFKLSTSLANYISGTFVASSGSQSGTHTISVGGLKVSTNSFLPPTIQTFTSSSGTYTFPTSPRKPVYIRVRAVGGGGGGGGGGYTGGSAGGAGGNTTFGSSFITANGGSGGAAASSNPYGGAGGSASIASGAIGLAVHGGSGGTGTEAGGSINQYQTGGHGGVSALGGAGFGSLITTTAGSAATNSGSGGGGGGGDVNVQAGGAGGGGGAGGFVDAIIQSPASTYSYAIGAAGSAGTAGTNGGAGGAGGSGYIEVTEYYQ